MQPDKKCTPMTLKPIKISNIVLDLETIDSEATKKDVWQVWVKDESKMKTLLANLSQRTSQVQVDTAIGKGESVEFSMTGNSGKIYIIGYYIMDDDDSNIGKSNNTQATCDTSENTKPKYLMSNLIKMFLKYFSLWRWFTFIWYNWFWFVQPNRPTCITKSETFPKNSDE